MKKTAIKGMSLLFVLFVVAAFATGVQAQDAADNAVSYTHLTLPTKA